MMPKFTAKLTPEAQETLRVVQTLPQNILQGVARAMNEQNQYTIFHIVRAYMSFPRQGPSVEIGLRAQSGKGRASLSSSKAKVVGQSVQSAIGSNISYMAAHEFGATIPAHDIVAKGGALKFRIGDRVLFRKKVHIPEVELPARAPVQHGIEDRLDDYSAAISAEIQKVWDGGKS